MENITMNDVIDEILTAREDDVFKLAIYLSADNDDKIADEIIVGRKNIVVTQNDYDNNMIAIKLIFNNNKDFDMVNQICQEYLHCRDEMSAKFILDLIEQDNRDYGISMEVQCVYTLTDGKMILFTGYLSGNGEEYEVDENNCNKKKKSSSDDINDMSPELARDFSDVEQNKSVEKETANEKETEEKLKIKQYNDELIEQFHNEIVKMIQQEEIAKKRKKYLER